MSGDVVDLGAAWLARAVQRIEDAEPWLLVDVLRAVGVDLRRLHRAGALTGGAPFNTLLRAAIRADVPSASAAFLLAGDARPWVRHELARGPVSAADLAEAAAMLGVRPRALRKALKHLDARRTHTHGQTLPGYSRRGVARWSMTTGVQRDDG